MATEIEPDNIRNLPSYGATEKYLGELGEAYFQRQNATGILASRYNQFIFEPYISERDDVLDFGCGGGHLLQVLNPGTKTGVEINPAARARAAQLGISVFSSLEELGSKTFSRIVTSHALEHVPSPYEVLAQMRRFLRPDGLLLWLSPMDDWRARHQRSWTANDADMHLYTWTPLLIGNLLSAAGYVPHSVSVLSHACPPAIVSERLWKISPSLFHSIARICAIVRKQRQIFVVASTAQS